MTYVRCINNQGYEASLIKGAIYKVLPYDGDHASLRVIDNEGEDYLYDASRFEPVSVNCAHHDATETVTVRLDSLLKGILRAEALAAQTSVSALLRAWIDERLDLRESRNRQPAPNNWVKLTREAGRKNCGYPRGN